MIKHHSAYDRIVWDFNGTILDDLWHGIHAVNTLLRQRNLPEILDLDRYYSVFGFPIQEYYGKLGLLDNDDYDVVAVEWITEYRREEASIPPRHDAVALIQKLHQKGVKQTVLSASEKGMLTQQLGYLDLLPYFDDILGRGDIYAADKTKIAVAYREQHPNENILMIGDTDHDYETASAAGFDCVLVAGGHQSPAYLKTLGCDVAESFKELEDILLAN